MIRGTLLFLFLFLVLNVPLYAPMVRAGTENFQKEHVQNGNTVFLETETGGSHFQKGTWNAGFALAGGPGIEDLGSTQRHDLALISAHVGRTMTDIVGENSWVQGNLEFRAEVYAGVEHNENPAHLGGLTPLLRYHFIPGGRVVPHMEAGVGIVLTDIGEPDLSTVFQFSPQAGVGASFLWQKDMALNLGVRFLHISNASIKRPNHGVNTLLFSAGLSWFIE